MLAARPVKKHRTKPGELLALMRAHRVEKARQPDLSYEEYALEILERGVYLQAPASKIMWGAPTSKPSNRRQ